MSLAPSIVIYEFLKIFYDYLTSALQAATSSVVNIALVNNTVKLKLLVDSIADAARR